MTPDALFEEYQHLAKSTVWKLFINPKSIAKRKGIDLDDLYQYANEGLWEAALKYDGSKGRTFQNFAITNIRWLLVEKLRRDCKKFSFRGTNIDYKEIESKVGFVSLDDKANINDEVASTYHELIGSDYNLEGETNEKIICEKIIDSIPPRTLEFIKLKANGHTIREIGKKYGISHQAVNIHINKVIKNIKRSGYVYEFS